MGTPSPANELKLKKAIDALNYRRFLCITDASRHFNVDYDLLRARRKGRKTNYTRGGKNKKLVDKEEAILILYYERCIKVGRPLERPYIVAAANTILRAAGKKPVSKPWISR
jgi:hypothetical protein